MIPPSDRPESSPDRGKNYRIMGKKNDKAKPVEPPAAQPDAQVASPVPVPPAVPAPAPAAPAKAPARKPAAKKLVVKKAVKKAPAKKLPAITVEDISLRAYFIAEHRHKHGLHGDAHSDWVEAERQLKAERKKKAAKKPAKKKAK
jgi:hypothetical protein